jgi:hypothetical protein
MAWLEAPVAESRLLVNELFMIRQADLIIDET